jgi:hypothetical protein
MKMARGWGMGGEITVKGARKSRPLLFIFAAAGSRSGGQISSQNEIHTVTSYVKQMIPSFTSFPSQPLQPVSEVSASSSRHKSSRKDRKRSRERARDDDEPEKRRHRHKHKHKHRDHEYDLKEDERQEASSSSATFFSDYKGNRAATHGGGTDSIRVPKYNLVARTSLPNFVKYN